MNCGASPSEIQQAFDAIRRNSIWGEGSARRTIEFSRTPDGATRSEAVAALSEMLRRDTRHQVTDLVAFTDRAPDVAWKCRVVVG
jgi:hypothetical protein